MESLSFLNFILSREEADALLESGLLLSSMDKGSFIKPSRRITMADLLRIWVRDYVKPNTAPTTGEKY